jgi:hypothetical protein
MPKPIVIHSRNGDKRTLLKVSENEYTLSGRSLYHRMGWNEGGVVNFMDFEGGPFISVGLPISLFGAKHDERKIVDIKVEEGLPTEDIKVNLKVA